MKKILLPIALAVVMLSGLLLGCSQSAEPVRELMPARTDRTPATLSPPIGSPTPAAPEMVIDSSGEVVSAESPVPSGEPVIMPGRVPSSAKTPASPEEIAMEWQVYHDGTYGYEIRYPPDYIIIERARQLELQPLSQVLFQDHMLANSDTAALQPPKFYIEVFDNSSQLPVEQWLEAHGLLGGAKKFQMEPYSLAGVEGARVSSPLLMAPNSFIYLPRGNYIFKLTPTDERSEQVLATFKFTE